MPKTAWANLTRQQGLWKLVAIVLIVLLSLYPLHRIHQIVRDRQLTSEEVEVDLAKAWGGAQRIAGPILILPVAVAQKGFKTALDENGRSKGRRYLFLLPEELQIEGLMTPERRRRGIYQAILYRSHITLTGRFLLPDYESLGVQPKDLLWDEARLEIRIADLRGLSDVSEAKWNDRLLQPASARPDSRAVSLPLWDGGDSPVAWPGQFRIALTLNGSEALTFLPLGRVSQMALAAPWPHPSFGGTLLPEESVIDKEGFTAAWRLRHFDRYLADLWLQGSDDPWPAIRSADLRLASTRLVEPVDSYLMSERSVKYGLLFVALISAVLFVFEAIAAARIHPVQYTMVALALCLFFLLLLSLSEVIGFAAGYSAAAGLTTLLLGGYVGSVLLSWRRGMTLGGLLAIVYATLYITLRAEDHALLLGASLLFVALAMAMFITRKIDWYAVLAGGDAARLAEKNTDS